MELWELRGDLTLGNYLITSAMLMTEKDAKYAVYELGGKPKFKSEGEFLIGYFNTVANAIGVVEEAIYNAEYENPEKLFT